MRIPSALLVVAAVILALPFGWGLGVLLAYMIAGPEFGVLPALTIPIAILASIVFVLASSLPAQTRLLIMAAGTGIFVLIGLVTAYR